MLGPAPIPSTAGHCMGQDHFGTGSPRQLGRVTALCMEAGSRAPVSRSPTSAQLTATAAPFPLVAWVSEASRLPSHTNLSLQTHSVDHPPTSQPVLSVHPGLSMQVSLPVPYRVPADVPSRTALSLLQPDHGEGGSRVCTLKVTRG